MYYLIQRNFKLWSYISRVIGLNIECVHTERLLINNYNLSE